MTIENGEQFFIGNIMFQVANYETHNDTPVKFPLKFGLSIWGPEQKHPVKNIDDFAPETRDENGIVEENGKWYIVSHPLLKAIEFKSNEHLENAISALKILESTIDLDEDVEVYNAGDTISITNKGQVSGTVVGKIEVNNKS